MKHHPIRLKNVSVHNLKGVDLELNPGELILFTGVSGSGKSSMAFDTLYVEGQRRYIESLSTAAKRVLGGEMSKPDVESVTGLSPTIAIEQKSVGKNPRSTVGTLTEVYDHLRLLFSLIATPHCPITGKPVESQSRETIIRRINTLPDSHRLIILAPFATEKKGEFKEEFAHLLKKGFTRLRVDGEMIELEEPPLLDKNQTHTIEIVVDRIRHTKENASRLAEAILTALELGGGMLSVIDLDDHNFEQFFSTHAYSKEAKASYPPLEPAFFSFNHPSGMCDACHGLGVTKTFNLDLIIDSDLSIEEDCCLIAPSFTTVRHGNIYRNLAELYDFSLKTPWRELPENAKKVFLYGNKKKWTKMHFIHPTRNISWTDYVGWRGVLGDAMKRYAEAKSDGYKKKMENLMIHQKCPTCDGARLKPYPAAAKLFGKTIQELTSCSIEHLSTFFSSLQLSESEEKIGGELVLEIKRRLHFLLDVGLGYLMLDRTAPTLSGGEGQRVRLAAQIGCGLVGVTYILDEPSIGLHACDNTKLIASLKQLRDSGNTVIVVEHDEETILAADRIVEFGPGPGRMGGTIVVNGTMDELLATENSLTADYLTGRKTITTNTQKREPSGTLSLYGATHHNLKGCDLHIPLGLMTAITGVSGSGKSSLICDTLHPALARVLHRSETICGPYLRLEGEQQIDKVIAIDQTPIGRTPRSNPATYIKLFDDIRNLFSTLPAAQAKGFTPGRFSFNVKEGSCAMCHGMGMVKVDMDFLEDQWVTCQSCQNRRFDTETLSITYKGKNIHDVLEMTVKEALELFHAIPKIVKKLELLAQVGLKYLTLGQSSTTLSGGEAQRIKLAKELVRPATGKTLYILDEPTTGLHFHDISALLSVLNVLVDRGNTLVIIEHNLDLIKRADHVIDLGPKAGEGGGEIVAAGKPEEIAKLDTPTGRALSAVFEKATETKSTSFESSEIITLSGAEQNNLKHLSLTIPRGQITVCTGPSGSGKSSLAFETIYAEGQRRYSESLSPYARQYVKMMPKPKLTSIDGLSPAIAIEQKLTSGNPRSTVGTQTEIYDYLRILFAKKGVCYDPKTGEKIENLTYDNVVDKLLKYQDERCILLAPLTLPSSFEELQFELQKEGFLRIDLDGQLYDLDEKIPFDKKKKHTLSLVIDRLKLDPKNRSRLAEAIEKGATIGKGEIRAKIKDELLSFTFSTREISPHEFSFNHQDGMCLTCMGLGVEYGAHFEKSSELMDLSTYGLCELFMTHPDVKELYTFFEKEGIDLDAPLRDLLPSKRRLLLRGSDKPIKMRGLLITWRGFEPTLAWMGKHAYAEIKTPLLSLLDELPCSSCEGTRLNARARHIRLGKHSISSLCALPISQTLPYLKTHTKDDKVLEDVLAALFSRLNFLEEVGLGYLSLDRKAPTLSNGESQRIRLARQLGSELTGVLYVLDEPTVGLHPQDNERLASALTRLKALGNTLLLVEHDPLTMKLADHVIEFGPGAGSLGGHVVYQGSFDGMAKDEQSLTGAYLSGKRSLPKSEKKRVAKASLPIKHAKAHNLKNLSFDLPTGGILCTLTGVSGSGKSTLLREIHKQVLGEFDKIIVVDQNPIGQTSRADVGTYTDIVTTLRSFYSGLPAAATKGLKPRYFSPNHKKGMCSHCMGMGYKKVDRLFLPPVKVKCERCEGMRLNPVSLQVTYQDLNFGQVLQLTVDEASQLFDVIPKAKRQLDLLKEVGLGYLKLGQEVATLSGGEAQRLKLSRELSKRRSHQTLFLIDEPTTGLHLNDIEKLFKVLDRLTEKGATIVTIEHNTDFIEASDFVIDMGPGSGEQGGEIVAMGTPNQIKQNKESITGQYLYE